MGLYAQLIDASIKCPQCDTRHTDTWQFHFGDVHDLPEYRIGDDIKWNSGQCFGSETMEEVYAVAYPNAEVFCPGCTKHVLGQVAIINGKVIALELLEVGAWRAELFYVGSEKKPYYFAEKRRGRVTDIPPSCT